MIGVSMGAHDPTDSTIGRFQNCFGMCLVFGTRIDHEYFVISNEIRICASTGHVAGIRRSDAAHER
jgi:hypothetical protein